MKEEEEKKTVNWEVRDPKPPVIRNSGAMVCGYPTYPEHAHFTE